MSNMHTFPHMPSQGADAISRVSVVCCITEMVLLLFTPTSIRECENTSDTAVGHGASLRARFSCAEGYP